MLCGQIRGIILRHCGETLLCQPAGAHMMIAKIMQRRVVSAAVLDGEFAASAKAAAAYGRKNRRGLTRNRVKPALDHSVDARHQAQERSRIGMIGSAQDFLDM